MTSSREARDHRSAQTEVLEILHRRLERLETSNRRLKMAAGLVILLGIAFVTMGSGSEAVPEAKVTKTVKAESFIVVDEDGNERAFLGTTPADGSVLILRDRKKNARVSLVSAEDGTSAVLLGNQTGTPHLLLRVRPWATPSIELADGERRRRLKLALGGDGSPAITFMKVGRNPRMKLSLDGDGSPALVMNDGAFRSRVTLDLTGNGEPRFELVKDSPLSTGTK